MDSVLAIRRKTTKVGGGYICFMYIFECAMMYCAKRVGSSCSPDMILRQPGYSMVMGRCESASHVFSLYSANSWLLCNCVNNQILHTNTWSRSAVSIYDMFASQENPAILWELTVNVLVPAVERCARSHLLDENFAELVGLAWGEHWYYSWW